MAGKTIVQKTKEAQAYLVVLQETLEIKKQLENIQLDTSLNATTQIVEKPTVEVKSTPKPATKTVRKNTSYGKKTWYLESWKVGDRTVPQFGFLLSKARAWIEEKEANHVRVSKQEASVKIGEIMKARSS